jgi:hypothetical protein
MISKQLPHGPPCRPARPHKPLLLGPPPLAPVHTMDDLGAAQPQGPADHSRCRAMEPVHPKVIDDLRAIADQMAYIGYVRT